MMAKIHI